MLEFLRQGANTFIAKILMGIVGGSFVVWGVGDVVRSGFGSSTYALKVGEFVYTPAMVRQQFDRDFIRFQQRFPNLTVAQAVQIGMVDQTVQRLAGEAALDMAARDLGAVVSDEALRQQIFTNRSFFDEKGQFSRATFLQVLQQNQMTEAAYVAELRQSVVRSRLSAPAEANAGAPHILTEALNRFNNEKRRAGVLLIPAASLTITASPDAAGLEAVYKAHLTTFSQPETRSLSAITITADEMAKQIKVNETDIAEAYKANPAAYAEPEHRTITMVVAADQVSATVLMVSAKDANGLSEAASKANLPAPLVLENQIASDLPPDVAAVVFAAKAGAVVGPVQTAFGWQVFAVTTITPAQNRTLAEAHDAVKLALVQARTGDRLNEAATALQEALGSGDTMEGAAKKLSLPFIKVGPLNSRGNGPDDKPAATLPAQALGAQIIKAGFSQPQGEANRVLPAGDEAFVAVRVDSITPPQPKPLEAVKADVSKLWLQEQQQKAAIALAEGFASQRTVQDLPTVAFGKPQWNWSVSPPVSRAGNGSKDGNGGGLAPEVVNALFKLTAPQMVAVAVAQGAAVVSLAGVTAADNAATAPELTALADTLKLDMGHDIAAQMTDAFKRRYNASVNQAAIKTAF